MAVNIELLKGDLPIEELQEMLPEAQAEGVRTVERLINEWNDGTNRFARLGEALFIARSDGRIVGFGGRIIDPYLNDMCVARVRRVYVVPAMRRQGIAQKLMQEIMGVPAGSFQTMVLRTQNPAACALYEGLGFVRTKVDGDLISYQIQLAA